MRLIFLLLFTNLVITLFASDSITYKEKYRPQYHFTPAHRWIGDPCGTIRHNGRYMAYSWGAATSDDLIHWNELNDHAIKGLPRDISAFTGSIVVDRGNTAGYGADALIAAFTSFDEHSKKQSQSIAFSLDNGATFQYYDLNPVIDIWSTEFRDPTVIWHSESNRWIMAVAKALEKKIAFYSSTDLKHWEWLSDFGPMGDSEKSWECPDLFQLPTEDGKKKWVLVISVNWAREQYFVGDFDGKRFIPERPEASPLYVDDGFDYYASRVFQNFDNPSADDVYTIGWVNTWDYATAAPSEWGKGIWSIPRKLSLYSTPDGMRMRQQPIGSLATLRKSPIKINRRLRPGVTKLPAISPFGNVYEMKLAIKTDKPDICGVNICSGNGYKVTISYDSQTKYLVVDRTASTDVSIPKFDRISHTRIPDKNGILDLDIFVDKSTVEIFVNNGEKTLTMLTYSPDTTTEANLFSLNGTTEVSLSAWPMKSIW